MKKKLLLSIILLFLTASIAVASATSRSEALSVLNGLLNKDAEVRHPEEFKMLINVYFSGVRYLQENKIELAGKYFSLVKKYGEILGPYFTKDQNGETNAVAKLNIATPGQPGRDTQAADPHADSSSGQGHELLKIEMEASVPHQEAGVQPESDDESSSGQQTVESAPVQIANPPVSDTTLNYGQTLKMVNRHILPKMMTDGLLINVADCTLYFFKDGRLKSQLPVVVGRAKSSDVRSWQTPLGNFKVTEKIKNPTWHIPQSIQKEMEDEGQEVQSEIPPGPDNPLGKYAIRTSLPGILIHGTNVSSFKNGYKSHGCIRVSASKIESLFNEITIDTVGEIIYQPIIITANDNGKIFLEVHKDIYRNIKDIGSKVRETIKDLKLESSVDWKKVTRTVKGKSGFAEDVSL